MAGLKKNLFYNTILTISQMLIPIITFPYITRVLGPDGYGKVSFVDSIVQYIILIAALGIPIYGVREVAKVRDEPEKLSKLYTELFIIHFVLTFILSIGYILMFLFVPKLESSSTLFTIGIGLLYFTVLPTEWLFQGLEKMAFIVKRTLFIRIVFVVVIFLTVKSKGDINWYYSISLLMLIANAVTNLFVSSKLVKFVLTDLDIKRHLSPLGYIFSGNLAISVYLIMDSILLGFFASENAVGYYTTAMRISKIFISLVTALSVVIIPRLSFAFRENEFEEVRRMLYKSFDYVIFLTIPISVGLYLTASEVVMLLAGKAFQPAILTVKILSPMAFIIGMASIFAYQILIPMGKEKIYLIAVTIGMFFSVTMNILLIPEFKQNGAAFTSILTEVLVSIVAFYLSYKHFKYTIPWPSFFKALISTVPFYPIIILFNNNCDNLIVRLALIVSNCILVYLAAQYFVWKNATISEGYNTLMRKFSN